MEKLPKATVDRFCHKIVQYEGSSKSFTCWRNKNHTGRCMPYMEEPANVVIEKESK